MSAYETYIEYAVSVLDSHDKPVVVPFYIENDTVVGQQTGIAISILNVRRRMPLGVPGVVIPCLQRLAGVRVFVPVVSQGFSGYDAHGRIISRSHCGSKRYFQGI
jgi:hypothetical protein